MKLDNLDVEPYKWGDDKGSAPNLNAKLEKILLNNQDMTGWIDTDKAIAQIKSTILKELEREWLKYQMFVPDEDLSNKTKDEVKMYEGGYNQALTDCLEVVRRILQ